MGALTLKSFPFELRGWDIEEFESIDPTDGFATNIKVYINKNQVIQIEPDYNEYSFNIWITDKTRQFFDSIFNGWLSKIEINSSISDKYLKMLRNLTINLYAFDICNNNIFRIYHFIIVINNIGIEILSVIKFLSHKYSFIKIRLNDSLKINNDLESNFQINKSLSNRNFGFSTLCLVISTNSRLEGSYLNLSLRQRFYKGLFKCLVIGSYVDLTFPVSFLGSNLKILTNIIKGNNAYCLEIKQSINFTLILNSEFFKRNDSNYILKNIQILKYSKILKNIWTGHNTLNSNLGITGLLSLESFKSLSSEDLLTFSSIYFINSFPNNVSNLKKVIELKLLSYHLNRNIEQKPNITKLFIDQNIHINNNFEMYNQIEFIKKKYFYIPTNTFFSHNETFINTEGFTKNANSIISQKTYKSNWQILKRLVEHIREKISFINNKNNEIITFDYSYISNLKNFLYFNYYATKMLTSLCYSFNNKNNHFYIDISKFKNVTQKVSNTKLKYWLDDFYSGGKDNYSFNSLVLIDCSKISRTETSNFF